MRLIKQNFWYKKRCWKIWISFSLILEMKIEAQKKGSGTGPMSYLSLSKEQVIKTKVEGER